MPNLERSRGMLAALTLLLGACAPKTDAPTPAPTASPPPTAALITIDSHDDIPLDFATPAVDPATADLQVNLNKMKAGGLTAGFFIVYVGQSARTPENYTQAENDALTKFAAIHRMAEDLYPDRIEIAYRADDVERIAAAGKLVPFFENFSIEILGLMAIKSHNSACI